MQGKIIQVSISPGGIPKRAIDFGKITFNGLHGDSWAHPQFHGGPLQAILLIAEEVIEALKSQGFPLFPGALGENLTTSGLDPNQWRIGQVFRAGTARLELTKVRIPCSTIQIYGDSSGRAIGPAIYDSLVKSGDTCSPVWGYSGMYARVLTEGFVRAGDLIELETEQA
jgi:MOSC domain-containing protein YiiM